MVIGGDHYKSNPSYENDEMTRDYFCAMEKSESVKVLYPIMKPNSCVGNMKVIKTILDLSIVHIRSNFVRQKRLTKFSTRTTIRATITDIIKVTCNAISEAFKTSRR